MRCFLFILSILILGACKQKKSGDNATGAPAASITTGKWKTHKKGSVSIDYPPTWILDQSGANRTSFVILSPRESEADQFRENVNLMIQDVTAQGYTMDSYVNTSINQINKYLQSANISRTESVASPYGPCHELEYTARQQGILLQFTQRHWLIDGISYILTFTSEPNSDPRFAETSDKMFDSFQIR